MGKTEFELVEMFPTSAEEIFDALLSSEGHSLMTGSPAEVDGRVGGAFSAWDGYIWGTTLEMDRPRRILQAWRTSEFPEESPDAQVEILLEKVNDGTKLTLRHSKIPEEQADGYKLGWIDFYFKPMREYFGK